MSVKKWVTQFIVLLTIILVVTAAGTHSVFAEFGVDTQSFESGKAMEVKLYDDAFNPKVITIPSGRTTTLKLKNEGKKKHTFTVEKLSIEEEVQPGQEKTITVNPKNAGTYELICRYHFQEGMVGKVIVK
ncbi:cupredoxin domain-containing protein [Neobacillus rhizosphaerae]|uniref:cupredoxin domain-containing protein n=1 Tax=Neobacillus rhizosphaerae TaxID=2880965 RepID=UPI003D28B571